MKTFTTKIAVEGSKATFKITVPYRTVRELEAEGWDVRGWARVKVDGIAPFFAYLRRPPSRNSVDLAVSPRLFPTARHGDLFTAGIERANRYRATFWTDAEGFDWLPFVDTERYFPTETIDGRLLLWNRYEEPFVMKRVTPVAETYRLLGWYQAEGSKSENAPDFTWANANPIAVRYYAELLRVWGLGKDRLSMEVLRSKGEKSAEARKAFEIEGLEVVAERIRSGAGEHAAVIHVRKSQPLLRLVKAALANVFTEDFPSKEAALQYALGWLDGDGCVTIIKHESMTFELRLAGHDDEQHIVMSALKQAFGWERGLGKFGGIRHHTNRTLNLLEAAQLGVAGAFSFSMNRARLLWALHKRLEARTAPLLIGSRGRTVTTDEAAAEAQKLFDTHLAAEVEELRRHPLAQVNFSTGEKGLAYPSRV